MKEEMYNKMIKRIRAIKNDKRGVLSIWINMLIALFGASLIYALMYDILCVKIINLAIDIAPSTVPQTYYHDIDYFRLLFKVLPFFMFFGIILWAFQRAQKREYIGG